MNKNEFKRLVSEIRKDKQLKHVFYQNAVINPSVKTLYSLFLLQEKNSVNYKCIDGYHTFSKDQLKEIYTIVQEQLQTWFDWEMKVFLQINKCKNISDFFNVDYKF